MTTEQTKSQLTANRYANQTELDHAIATLHSLGESAFAGLVENAIKHGIESYRPLVVTDFNAVGETQILLVPAGTHALPQTVLQTPRFIIGLPESGKNKPTPLQAKNLDSIRAAGGIAMVINEDNIDDARHLLGEL